ncbi:MAG: hypothetical protein WCH30_06580 [Chlorobiaceae bacterium]
MRDLVIKIKKALQSIEEEKGEFRIKCLVAKDPSDMLWDLILSAEWFEDDLMKRLDYLSERILGDFDIDCMLHFSGIITYTVKSSHPLLDMLRVVQENNRIGKYSDLGQGYVIVDSHSELAQLIIPLNNSEILVPA